MPAGILHVFLNEAQTFIQCQLWNLAAINTPTSPGDKTLHAVITLLSPQKGKYLDGSISDSTGKMRVVGFTEAKRIKLEKTLQG